MNIIDDTFNKSIIKNTASKVVENFYNMTEKQKMHLNYVSPYLSNKYEEMLALLLFNEAEKLSVDISEVPNNIVMLYTYYHDFLLDCLIEFDNKHLN